MCHTNPTAYSFSILLPCSLTADSGQAWGLLELSPCLWRTYLATMLPGGAPQGLSFLMHRREGHRNPSHPHAQRQDQGEETKTHWDVTAHALYG